ncbi:hypothetical protein [Magnetospirillum sp. UT-4]|uniref:hypothetical protein n=1 Tax=Magnetospirillum sp. UT-4 TaxID=2681467 RepID=UPI0015737425|nr:hypothetical protein [Magnetospirillum sp. UT-4]
MSTHPVTSQCLTPRIEQVRHHLTRGEWACGHAIVSAMLKCAERGGCGGHADCACAALSMLGRVRSLLTH